MNLDLIIRSGAFGLLIIFSACGDAGRKKAAISKETAQASDTLDPVFITEQVPFDTDDPAIWFKADAPDSSLIIGTDKHENGGLYVFDMQGKILRDKYVPLKRPNNVDLRQDMLLTGSDRVWTVVAASERLTSNLRLFSFPEMTPLDGGGIPMFEGESGEDFRDLMGVSLFYDQTNQRAYVIMGRKNGPTDRTYLWQYEIEPQGDTALTARFVRKFGNFSGLKEIEAIVVDDRNGFVYYSDEGVGTRKYYASPERGNEELALIPADHVKDDNEGLAVYPTGDSSGYLFQSDQQAQRLLIYDRKFPHNLIDSLPYRALETDGIDIYPNAIGARFPKGILVAMSDDKRFHVYDIQAILNHLNKE